MHKATLENLGPRTYGQARRSRTLSVCERYVVATILALLVATPFAPAHALPQCRACDTVCKAYTYKTSIVSGKRVRVFSLSAACRKCRGMPCLGDGGVANFNALFSTHLPREFGPIPVLHCPADPQKKCTVTYYSQ